MHSRIIVIRHQISRALQEHLDQALEGYDYLYYGPGMNLQNQRVLIVTELNDLGYDLPLLEWLSDTLADDTFEGSLGALIVKSNSDLYTKSFAQDLILHTNGSGLSFIGHSVVEIVEDYQNFLTWQKTYDMSLEAICTMQCVDLVKRLMTQTLTSCQDILALHASSYETSNTLGLWHLVKKHLEANGQSPREIHIENGTVVDCKGCPFSTCMHFGKHHSCFYGGIMVEEVLPAIEKADAIIWVCPNYNDAISANLLAVINRLTVLYRQISFHDKLFYAVVVSGNSGSDSVAKQLIGALNINKGFMLPAKFAVMAIANEPLKVLELEGVEAKAAAMAHRINSFCHKYE